MPSFNRPDAARGFADQRIGFALGIHGIDTQGTDHQLRIFSVNRDKTVAELRINQPLWPRIEELLKVRPPLSKPRAAATLACICSAVDTTRSAIGDSGVSADPRLIAGAGAGTVSCGEWLQFRSFEEKKGNAQLQLQVNSLRSQSWIDGYLSGVNVTSSGGPDIFASRPNGVAMYVWVDNYCRSKPLDKIAEAADGLIKELQSRAGR